MLRQPIFRTTSRTYGALLERSQRVMHAPAPVHDRPSADARAFQRVPFSVDDDSTGPEKISHVTSSDPGFYLAVGTVLSESVTSRMVATGSRYVSKLLSSSPGNWASICTLLERADLTAALVKLTGADYGTLLSDRYQGVAERFLSALSKVPHLVLVHEAVAGLPDAIYDEEIVELDEDDDGWNPRRAREYFGTIQESVRSGATKMLEDHHVLVTTYRRNAEASMLAAAFVDDTVSNLLFRLYVPSGRLYEAELARLLEMFHDWLTSVKGQEVRQGGYRTANGRVVEFFGNHDERAAGWRTELSEFQAFLAVVDNAPAAEALLIGVGLEPSRATEIVSRYARDTRRVLLDARHERDRRLLSIQQQIESELSEEASGIPAVALQQIASALIPASPVAAMSALSLPNGVWSPNTGGPVVVNQQFIGQVTGIVAQNISGPVSTGTPMEDLIRLIREVGGRDAERLEVDTRELADSGAPPANRLNSRQHIKAFLIRNRDRLEAAAFQALWKWLEVQVGHIGH